MKTHVEEDRAEQDKGPADHAIAQPVHAPHQPHLSPWDLNLQRWLSGRVERSVPWREELMLLTVPIETRGLAGGAGPHGVIAGADVGVRGKPRPEPFQRFLQEKARQVGETAKD